MASVRFLHDGLFCERVVLADESLRDLQRELCGVFGKAFPSTMATLKIGAVHFDSFEDLPFRDWVRPYLIVEHERASDPGRERA